MRKLQQLNQLKDEAHLKKVVNPSLKFRLAGGKLYFIVTCLLVLLQTKTTIL